MKPWLSLLVFTAFCAPALDAAAQDMSPEQPAQPAQPPPNRMHEPDAWRVGAGARAMQVGDPSLDPYAEKDSLAFFSIDATKELALSRRFSFAFGVAWDTGRTSAAARRSPSSLNVNRLGVPLELRYHPTYWIYAFGRLAPGATSLSASIQDNGSSTPLRSQGWVFSSDVMVGASVLLGPYGRPQKRLFRLWATPEIGYAWSTARDMRFERERPDDDPRPTGSVALSDLAMRGLTGRLTVAASF